MFFETYAQSMAQVLARATRERPETNMLSSLRPTFSLFTAFLLGLSLFAALPPFVSAAPFHRLDRADSPLAPLDVPAPTKPRPLRPKPRTTTDPVSGSTRFLDDFINMLVDEVKDGDPPVIHDPIQIYAEPPYPRYRDSKTKKKQKADANDSGEEDCALESCLAMEECVHMAGHPFQAM